MTKDNFLLEGEVFSLKDKRQEDIILLSNDEINDKYFRGEIRIVTEQARYPLDNIEAMLDSKKYNLNPEYQRRKRWDTARKSRLIESFIMNVPIPPIFLYEVEYSLYEVMDGLQRLTSIYDFYKGSFKLKGLQYWKELNGRTYQTLPEQVKRGIDRRYLSSIVLLQETAKSTEEADFLKQIVFERLNSGGEKLTPQETRNALYNGKFNQLCIKLAQNELFRKMWQIPLESEGEEKLLQNDSYRKMEDVELVLRFFAYRHIGKFNIKSVERFLDVYLDQANEYDNQTLIALEALFNDTVEWIYEIFGESAFYLTPFQKMNRTPFKSIYDPMMHVFAKNLGSKERLKGHEEQFRREIYADEQSLIIQGEKGRSIFDGRYNNKKDVQNRINFFQNFLTDFLAKI